MTLTWKPIAEYPKDLDPGPECYWGPDALVLVDGNYYVAHLEADMWLVRDCDDPECWCDLYPPRTPSHFILLSDLPAKP